MTTVTLSAGDVQLAWQLAHLSMQRYAHARGHYTNTIRTHFIGRAGEIACSRWLYALGLEHHNRFLDPAQDEWCDIETFAPVIRLEVKTWSRDYWPHLGRCVAASQLANIQRKADVIVWLVADVTPEATESLTSLTLELAGWSPVADLFGVTARPTGERQILNHQLRADQLRRLCDLFTPSSDERTTDMGTLFDDLDKQGEQESKGDGGGGVICQFRFEAGYKVFAKGLGNRESFFPYTPGNETSQKAALAKAKETGEKYGVTKSPSTAAQLVLRKNSVKGKEVTWKDDRFFTYPVWTESYKQILKPALVAAGVNAIGDYWGRISFKADPSGRKYKGQDGKEHDELVAYVAEIYKTEQDAIKAASKDAPAGAGNGNGHTLSIPPGYTADTWAKQADDIRKMRLAYIQKGAQGDEATKRAAEDYGATPDQVVQLLGLPVAPPPPAGVSSPMPGAVPVADDTIPF